MQLVKALLVNAEYKFIRGPGDLSNSNPRVAINLDRYPGADLERLHTYLYYENETAPDHDKTLKIALDKFLSNAISNKDADKIEELKAEEYKRAAAEKEKEKPKFEWILKNKKDKE